MANNLGQKLFTHTNSIAQDNWDTKTKDKKEATYVKC